MSRPRVYFAFRSPYSRLGLHKLARARIEADLVVFTGPPSGQAFADPAASPAKLAYYVSDVARMTARMGLPIARAKLDTDFAPANRAFILADREGLGLDFAIAVSDVRWGEGKDIADPDVLREAAVNAGWRPDGVAAAQDDAAVREAFRAQRALIEEDQAFGVPFVVWSGQKYWGHDRMELFLEDFAAARKPA